MVRPMRSTVTNANQYSPSCGAWYWKRFLVGGADSTHCQSPGRLPLNTLTKNFNSLSSALSRSSILTGRLNDRPLVKTFFGVVVCAAAVGAATSTSVPAIDQNFVVMTGSICNHRDKKPQKIRRSNWPRRDH